MLKKQVLLLLFILITGVSLSQKDKEGQIGTKEIVVHFSEGIKSIPAINKGEFYQVRVRGINRNLYKISLLNADTILSKAQQTPTFGAATFDMETISKLMAGIGSANTTLTPALTQLFGQIKSFDKDNLKNYRPAIANSLDDINRRMLSEKQYLALVRDRLILVAKSIDSVKLVVNKERLNALLENYKSTLPSYSDLLTVIENLRNDVSSHQQSHWQQRTAYVSYSDDKADDIAKEDQLKKNDAAIKSLYEEVNKAMVELQNSINADKTYELLSHVVFLKNNEIDDYVSWPTQFTGEQVRIVITATPRREEYNLQSYSTQLLVPIYIRKYNSIGLSFYGSTLHDEAYTTIKNKITDSTFNYTLKGEEIDKEEIGVAALLRFGKKWKKNNNIGTHFSLGAGVSLTNKVRPRILFGVGGTYGQTHMAALDLGGILGYVDRVRSTIGLNNAYDERPESITVSRLGFGGFISLGYIYQF
ncbi:MAG: hypothetical protein ACO1OT_02510 [Heyndrickxia sp.]